MAKLLNLVNKTIKKAAEVAKGGGNANTNTTTSTSSDKGSWIGTGVSPTTGQPTYSTGTSNRTSTSSYEDDLNRLKRAQQKVQAEQLKAQYDKTLNALADQEAQIKPTYQVQRNLATASSSQSARNFAEYLANRGLTRSGAAAQGEINRQGALMNTLGQLGTAEANAYQNIANARRDAQANYASGLALANAQIESDYYNRLFEENQRRRAEEQALRTQALGQYSDDYQARINELLAQGYSPNSLEVLQLQALRGQKVANNYSGAMNNAMQNIQMGNINYNNAAALGMTVDQANDYYLRSQAAAQAEAEAAAEQQAWERYIKEQQLYNDIRNTNSLIASRNNSGGGNKNLLSLSQVMSMADESDNPRSLVDVLYQNGQIAPDTRNTMYSMNTDWLNQAIVETPEYNQIAREVGNATSKEQGERIIYNYYQSGVNQAIIDKLMEDLNNDII